MKRWAITQGIETGIQIYLGFSPSLGLIKTGWAWGKKLVNGFKSVLEIEVFDLNFSDWA